MKATIYCHSPADEERLNFPGLNKVFVPSDNPYVPRHTTVSFSTDDSETLRSLIKYCRDNNFPVHLDDVYFPPAYTRRKCYHIKIDTTDQKFASWTCPPYISGLHSCDLGTDDYTDIHYTAELIVDDADIRDYILNKIRRQPPIYVYINVTELDLICRDGQS